MIYDDYNSIEYLDLFYNDCIKNRELHNAIVKKAHNKANLPNVIIIISAVISFAIIILGINLDNSFGNSLCTLGYYMFFAVLIIGGFLLTIFQKNKKKQANHEWKSSDNIHYGYLDEYLHLTNLKKFTDKKSRCLTQNSTFYEEQPEDVKPVLLIAIPFMIIGLLIAYIRFGNAWDKICVCFVLLLFGSIGLGLIGFGVIRAFLVVKTYDEIVDAVCIEVNSKISYGDMDSSSTVVYQPVYFAKCKNGHKYILFKNEFSNIQIPSIGDIVQLKVNSENPLKWARKNEWGRYGLFLLAGLAFAAAGIGVYIAIILKA